MNTSFYSRLTRFCKHTALATAVVEGLGLTAISLPVSAVEPALMAGYNKSVLLRDDGTLIVLPKSLISSPVTPTSGIPTVNSGTAVLNGVASLSNSSGGCVIFSGVGSMACNQSNDWGTNPIDFASVNGLSDVKKVASTGYPSLYYALKTDGNVVRGGSQNYPNNDVNNPPPTALMGLDNVADIFGNYPLIALKTNGSVLSVSTQNTTSVTLSAINGLPNNVSFISQGSYVPQNIAPDNLSQGGNAFLALTQTGSVWMWAGSWDGTQLSTPRLITGFPSNRTVKQITSARDLNDIQSWNQMNFALLDDGTVYSFGYYYSNTSGNYTYSEPTLVSGLSNVKELSKELSSVSYAISNSGGLSIWGYWNDNGAWGNHALTPVGLTDVVKASITHEYGLAMKSDGTVCGWGSNANGQLGETAPAFVPVSSPVCGIEDLIVSTNATACTAEYSITEKKVTFPQLLVQYINPLTSQKNVDLFKSGTGTNLQLNLLPDGATFQIPTNFNLTHVGKPASGDESCYPTYSGWDRTLGFPKVKVPMVIPGALPGMTLDLSVCYKATLNQSPIDATAFTAKSIQEINCQ